MKVQAIAHLINGTTITSIVIDTEAEAAKQGADHDDVLIAIGEVVDFWSDLSALGKFTMDVESGDTMSINVKHVTHVQIVGFDEAAVNAIKERKHNERQSIRRRAY